MLPGELIGDDGFINLEAEEAVAISGVDSYHKTEQLERKEAYVQVPEEQQYRHS